MHIVNINSVLNNHYYNFMSNKLIFTEHGRKLTFTLVNEEYNEET